MLAKLVVRTADRIAIRSGWARRRFGQQRGRIRVLTYHGLVPDELADRPWVPSHLVTVSQFRRQMAMLADLGPGIVQPLSEALTRTWAGTLPEAPTVCLTFDDGTADNVTLALPILKQHGFRATFFLATGYVDRSELMPNDVIRLLRGARIEGRRIGPPTPLCQQLLAKPGMNRGCSLFLYRAELQALWAASLHAVDPAGVSALRMMTWDEARALRDAGMEIGAHTVNHVILAREDRLTRHREIADSIGRVRSEIAQQDVPFSYPNGLPGDHDQEDAALLESLNVPYAVTGTPGWNDVATPRMALRRSCIGWQGSGHAFLAQVFGLQDPGKPGRLRVHPEANGTAAVFRPPAGFGGPVGRIE